MAKQGYLGAFYSKVFTKLVEDCEDEWDEEVNANVTSTADSTEGNYKEGSASAKLAITGDVVIDTLLATEKIDPAIDLKNHRRITLWIKSSKTMTTEGDLKLLLDDTAKCPDTPLEELPIPPLTAGEWKAVTLDLVTPGNLGAVISIGIKTHVVLADGDTINIDAVKAISSLVVADEIVGTGDGAETEFDLANANIDLDTLVVTLDAVATKDYEVTVKGHISFTTAPTTEADGIKASYTHWQIKQKGAFHNWVFSLAGDTAERTDFTSAGWKKFVGILKGWTGSAERFWLNSEWMAEVGTPLVVKFYTDEEGTLRYEGWALVTGIDVAAAVDTLIMEPIGFQGHGVLSYESD